MSSDEQPNCIDRELNLTHCNCTCLEVVHAPDSEEKTTLRRSSEVIGQTTLKCLEIFGSKDRAMPFCMDVQEVMIPSRKKVGWATEAMFGWKD